MKEHKILIAFYSRSGSNYVGGTIVDLKTGNTEVAAGMIEDVAGGDLFKIDPVRAYPDDYMRTTEIAKKELKENARPALKESLANIDDYDTVILGYPNWWGTMPMVVRTFLESKDFSGKTILPFCTHEGSGMGHSESDIKRLCPGAAVLSGLSILGGNVRRAEGDIARWLSDKGIIE
ncbi:NAD(P)H-dependent oxidoreductase [bacterium]|nr:NAD(P)H-dependent oxidoreductase [bacterium]